jgi:lipopolysaccharide/colanic/teichoic acid biosynthesis glycosyltransferase
VSKRLFDLAVSAAALLLLSAVLITLASLIAVSMGPPVLFRQWRPGLHGRPFVLYKFRTMRNPVSGESHADDVRITALGRVLRAFSVDELPELFNVLRGDMSLVGPRPLLMEYLPLYSDEQARRHEVRPGMTGWAQVNGRNAISWEEKFELDVWYVDHRTFLLDLRILWLTLLQVLRREGINQEGYATVAPFRGTRA